MGDHALAQLIASAVAEAQRPLVAAMNELRDEVALGQRESLMLSNPPDTNAKPDTPVHGKELGAQSSERGPLLRAKDVGMSEGEWRGAIRRGELRATKVGRAYVATQADFDAFLAARQVVPRPRKPRARRIDSATAAVERALATGYLRPSTPKGRP